MSNLDQDLILNIRSLAATGGLARCLAPLRGAKIFRTRYRRSTLRFDLQLPSGNPSGLFLQASDQRASALISGFLATQVLTAVGRGGTRK